MDRWESLEESGSLQASVSPHPNDNLHMVDDDPDLLDKKQGQLLLLVPRASSHGLMSVLVQ